MNKSTTKIYTYVYRKQNKNYKRDNSRNKKTKQEEKCFRDVRDIKCKRRLEEHHQPLRQETSFQWKFIFLHPLMSFRSQSNWKKGQNITL